LLAPLLLHRTGQTLSAIDGPPFPRLMLTRIRGDEDDIRANF